MTTQAPPTPTAPARPPDGWWTGHPRYRNYVFFSASGVVLSAACVVLLFGVHALATGHAAWQAYLANLGSVPGQILCWPLLLGTLFFAVRWLRVGVKIPQVPLGPLPAPPAAALWAAHFGGLLALSALLLLILSGVIL